MTVQTNLFQLLQEESLSHNAELQYKIADIYYSGTKDTERDYTKAFEWLTKASQNNHAISQFALASCYANGFGIDKNPLKAFEYYNLSANNGNKHAYYNLAQCYENGTGVKQDLFKALSFYIKSVLAGNQNGEQQIKQLYKAASETNLNVNHFCPSTVPHELSNLNFIKTNVFYTDNIDTVAEFIIAHKAIPEKDEEEFDFDEKDIRELSKYHKKIYGTAGTIANQKAESFSFSDSDGYGLVLLCSYTVNEKPFVMYLFCVFDSEELSNGIGKQLRTTSTANKNELSDLIERLENGEQLSDEDTAHFSELLSDFLTQKAKTAFQLSGNQLVILCYLATWTIAAILFAKFFF